MTSSVAPHLRTLADGSPIPTNLTQSPKTPFTIGKVMTLGNMIYGYSGMVNFDITAAASYPLITFTLEKNAMINVKFNCDWNILDGAGVATGYLISIDNVNIIQWISTVTRTATGAGNIENPESQFFVPAGRVCNIVVLNPDAAATLLASNVHIVGQYVSGAGEYHV